MFFRLHDIAKLVTVWNFCVQNRFGILQSLSEIKVEKLKILKQCKTADKRTDAGPKVIRKAHIKKYKITECDTCMSIIQNIYIVTVVNLLKIDGVLISKIYYKMASSRNTKF